MIFLPVAQQLYGVRRPQIKKDVRNDVPTQVRKREEAAISAVVKEGEHTHTATTQYEAASATQ